MDITLNHVIITVHDVDEALGFYRDALGLEVRNDVDTDAGRWLTLATTADGPEIVLSTPQSGRGDADADAMLALLTKGSLHTVFLRTSDLDKAFEQVSASGAEVLQEPMDQGWGPRDCAFRDPSGNMVRIAQA